MTTICGDEMAQRQKEALVVSQLAGLMISEALATTTREAVIDAFRTMVGRFDVEKRERLAAALEDLAREVRGAESTHGA